MHDAQTLADESAPSNWHELWPELGEPETYVTSFQLLFWYISLCQRGNLRPSHFRAKHGAPSFVWHIFTYFIHEPT